MLFKNIKFIDENLTVRENMYVGVCGGIIDYIGAEKPQKSYDEEYDGRNKLLSPAFVNLHTHSPMTLLRGYAENLPLDRWLNERVFPFEDRLNDDRAYIGTMMSEAEMLQSGTVSFTDMYFWGDGVLKAVAESGMKVNFGRSIVSFEDGDIENNTRFQESVYLTEKYHNSCDGRIKIDNSLHAEYTNTLSIIEQFGAYTKTTGQINHIHLSETQKEHEECKAKYGKTPAQLFYDCGIFDSPTVLAHCVWIEDSDIELLRKKGVTVAHCPASNLKLGSGVCNTYNLLQSGVNVGLGTDSAASNNSLGIMREMYLAALLPKGFLNRPDVLSPEEVFKMATVNGYRAQGRTDCGVIKVGNRADLTVLNLDSPNMYPDFNTFNNIVYSADKSNVMLTMADGRVLYKNGEFMTIDVERLGFEINKAVKEIVSEVRAND